MADVPAPDLVTTAQRALRCLDLTDLSETCSEHAIDDLCARALGRHGPVAAVCIWPQFVARAHAALKGGPVSLATVVNFPAGGEDVDRVIEDVAEALGDGAQEIDLVLAYEAVRRGDLDIAAEMVAAVREVVDQGRLLKVILARYYGLRVAGVSVVTNLAAGSEGASPSHQETKDTAAEASDRFERLIRSFAAELPHG